MDEAIFQKVYEYLEPVLPSEWEHTVFYACYTSGSYSMKYYYKTVDGSYVDCFSQSEVSKNQIMMAFMKIDKVLYPERANLDVSKRWNVLTMIFDSNGKMKVDFDYSDVEESRIETEQRWYKKYIE